MRIGQDNYIMGWPCRQETEATELTENSAPAEAVKFDSPVPLVTEARGIEGNEQWRGEHLVKPIPLRKGTRG